MPLIGGVDANRLWDFLIQALPSKDIEKLVDRRSNMADRVWRLENLYWIVDEGGQKVKFKLLDVQKELESKLWNLTLVLKARQQGITTFFCILYLDACLFMDNQRAGIIAHNREDAEAIFKDKIKFAYDNLPDDIKSSRKARTDSARELSFSNNSSIRVGTSLRSATLQWLHISEFGKICRKYPDKAEEIVSGSLNTVHAGQHVAIESTAEGNAGYFFDYCQSAIKKEKRGIPLTSMDFRFFFFGWYKDLRNYMSPEGILLPDELRIYFDELRDKHGIKLSPGQEAWYAKKWELQGPLMKREHPSIFEEAFEATIEGAYYKVQFDSIYKEGRILPLSYEPEINVDTWWDLGMNDTTVIWFSQTIGRNMYMIDYYENSGEGLGHYINILKSKGYIYGNHTAPHDIEVRELEGDGKTRREIVREKFGFMFRTAKRFLKNDQIEAVRSVLPHVYFNETKCSQGIKALENYRKEWDPKLGAFKDSPLHDWASNAADAFAVFATSHKFYDFKGVFVPKRGGKYSNKGRKWKTK